MRFFKTEKEKLQKRFHNARRQHNPEKMRAALAEGAEVDYLSEGNTELFLAAYYDYRDGVKLLLEHNANPNVKSDTGYTPLMSAASDGYFEVAELLIAHGAEINAVDKEGKTALHYAARTGRGSVVKLLLEKGADRRMTDNRMNTPADLADKEYPRLADLIRGKKREDVEAPADGWRLTATDEVSNVSDKREIGYRLTEIFNFGAGMYTRIARNLETGAESQSVRFFDEFTNRAAIDTARAALESLGGRAAERAPDKKKLPAPGGLEA